MTGTRALCLAAALVGCAAPMLPAPPPALGVDRPGAAIPGDLDLAFRLDLAAARRLFGPGFSRALVFDIADAKSDAKTAELIASALARADAAWVALRPGLATRSTDNVLLLRGDFGDLEPHSPGSDWGPPTDLGAGMRVYQRSAPKQRSAPALIYARTDDWLVFVSTAEVDAAERTIEQHAGDEHVDPPDHGIVSVAARVRPLVPLLAPNYPALAEALEGAVNLEGNAAADERGLAVDLSASFSNGTQATQAEHRTKLLLSVLARAKGPFATLARGAEATAVGATLVVRVRLDAKALAGLLGCVEGTAAC